MNAKKVKQIRKDLRDRGINFRDVDYDHKDHYKKNQKGTTVRTEQWFLYEGCGRQVYQQTKRGA